MRIPTPSLQMRSLPRHRTRVVTFPMVILLRNGLSDEFDPRAYSRVVAAVNEAQTESNRQLSDRAASENKHSGVTIGDLVCLGQGIVRMLHHEERVPCSRVGQV